MNYKFCVNMSHFLVDVREAVPALQLPLDVLPADLPLGRLHKLRAGLSAPAEQ